MATTPARPTSNYSPYLGLPNPIMRRRLEASALLAALSPDRPRSFGGKDYKDYLEIGVGVGKRSGALKAYGSSLRARDPLLYDQTREWVQQVGRDEAIRQGLESGLIFRNDEALSRSVLGADLSRFPSLLSADSVATIRGYYAPWVKQDAANRRQARLGTEATRTSSGSTQRATYAPRRLRSGGTILGGGDQTLLGG